jgi:hypothetical protein
VFHQIAMTMAVDAAAASQMFGVKRDAMWRDSEFVAA